MRSSIAAPDLASFYSRFRVAERALLTGHSHQAWPDVAFEAQQRAWLDAAELVDDKWARVEERGEWVREGFARLVGDDPRSIALGQNTHELVTRWLSALPLHERPRIVTTTGEFHSLRRQLDRLAEEGLEVAKVAARPVDGLAERLVEAVDDRTACVMVSSVLFETSEIVPGLERVATACDTVGAAMLVDAYHHLNVVPFDVTTMGLTSAFITGGGYKYCQLGEGNCFLRVPPDCRLRPVLTGWFAEFGDLERSPAHATGGAVVAQPTSPEGSVRYGAGAAAFAGATYDPTSHYRAAAVFAFHHERGLTPTRLRAISQRQVGLLRAGFERLDVDPDVARVEPMPDDRRGGFLAVRTARATELTRALRADGIWTDARGDVLRFGPAPYVTDDQLNRTVEALRSRLRNMNGDRARER